MRNNLKLCLLLSLFLAMFTVAVADTFPTGGGSDLPQNTVQIGEGTSNGYMPINTSKNYSYSQTIYTADEIGNQEIDIQRIAYYWNGAGAAPNSNKWTIYMKNIGHDKDAFSNNADWITMEDTNKVFDSYVYIPSEPGWIEITLHTFFPHNGINNLVIAVKESKLGNDSGDYYFHNTTSTLNAECSIRYSSDNDDLDLDNLPYGTLSSLYPNIRLNFDDLQDHSVFEYSPKKIDFGNLLFESPSITENIYITNTGLSTQYFTISKNDVKITGQHANLFNIDNTDFPFMLYRGQSAQIPVYFNGSTEGNYDANLEITYDGVPYEVELKATVLPENTIQIGTGEKREYMPVSAWYSYSYSQSIYMSDEINLDTSNKRIEKIAYHWNGSTEAPNSSEWTIFIGHTDKTKFNDNDDWIDLDDLIEVYQGHVDIPAIDKWIDIELNTPFIYNGNDNLVIAVRETKPEYDSYTSYFYNTTSTSGRSMYCQSDSNIPDPADPPTGTLIAAHPNIRMCFDYFPDNPEISVFPKNVDFGTIFFDAESNDINISVMNIGGVTLELDATAVEITGTNAALFSFDDSGFPFTLDTAETELIPVSLVGTVDGNVEATLEIIFDGKTHTVELSAHVLPEGVAIIGEGTSSQHQPMGVYYGYERSAAIYTSAEIGGAGIIESISWNVEKCGEYIVPLKIYLGTTTNTQFTAQTYDSLIQYMTLVHEGDYMFDSLGWQEFILNDPFVLVGSNLVVAVETNFGGIGADTYYGCANFYYTSATDTHMYYQGTSNIPTNVGNINSQRPNLKLVRSSFTGDPKLYVEPNTSYEFPLTMIDTIAQKEFMVSNVGGGNINITDISITGNGFTLATELTNVTLDSGDTYNLTVEYNPTEIGNYNASLLIKTSVGDHTVTLSGSCYDPVIREFPFSEGFEDDNFDESTDIYNWSQFDGPNIKGNFWTANNTKTTYNRTPRTGDWNVNLRYNSDATLVRQIMLEEGKGYSVEFWARQDASNGAFIKAVLGDNDQLTGDDVFDIVPETDVLNGDYQQFYGEFTAPSTGIYFLGINGRLTSAPWYISLDDISIDYNYAAPPNETVNLGENTTIFITGTNFEGAFKKEVELEDLTPIPNATFNPIDHQIWKLIGSGEATLTFTNNSSDNLWFAHIASGSWIAEEVNPNEDISVTINLDAKNADFEFAFGTGDDPTLPVELSSFTVILNSTNKPVISWTTESETGVNGFHIYRGTSKDFSDATLISELIEATNSSLTQTYTFIDESLYEDGIYYYWLGVSDLNGHGGYHGPVMLDYSHEGDENTTPEVALETKLTGAFPNPFNPGTNIGFELAEPSEVSISIYNVRGQLVRNFAPAEFEPGNWSIAWNGKDNGGRGVSSGIYHIRMTAGKKSFTTKALLMK